MIVTNSYHINGREFRKTRSDDGRYVVRDGVSYVEANDPAEFERTYEEGDLLPPEDLDDAEAFSIIFGGAE